MGTGIIAFCLNESKYYSIVLTAKGKKKEALNHAIKTRFLERNYVSCEYHAAAVLLEAVPFGFGLGA
jgi:hypothetical protein